MQIEIVATVLHQDPGSNFLSNLPATVMTFVDRWTRKILSLASVLMICVALSWHTHLCLAVFHSDVGGTTISNETFPAYDATKSTTIKRSRLRVNDIHRREQVVGEVVAGVRNFKPLLCNSEIFRVGSACTRTWSSMFGTTESHSSRIVIPCGVCILMNHASGILNLNGGIDIQGKLVVPDDLPINITTPAIIVQGELSMTSTKPVSGIPKIKVTLVGSNDVTFTPVDVNANACQGSTTCNAGKKAFVVAGGKVTCKFFNYIGKIMEIRFSSISLLPLPFSPF